MNRLPQGFLDYIGQYPRLGVLAQSLLTPPDVSIRLNRAKTDRTVSPDCQVPWCPEGQYLAERPVFTLDPALHQGAYYVQDASSMALSAVARELTADGQPVRYIDVCAAPGGKTTAAISALPSGSLVVCNEYDYRRAGILAENVAKWGSPYVIVSRGDTSRLRKLDGFFDIVAVDAPCSGEGMMRKDTVAVEQWSQGLVAQCAALQRDILLNAWQALRPGGALIYSTCTFNRVEDEDNLQWMVTELGAQPLPVAALDAAPGVVAGIDTPHPCYRFLPGLVRGEGLFIAVVRKPGHALRPTTKAAKADKPDRQFEALRRWVTTDVQLMADGERVFALPVSSTADMRHVASRLDTLSVGTHIADVKGRDLAPTHQLALSTMVNTSAFVTCDISREQALTYLRRDALTLPDGTPRGYVLLMYQGLPLGFVKNLGNRTNSLMPKEWRIRNC